MSPTTSTEFIDTSLFSTPSKLSYNDPNQKSVIRNHVLALLHDFPTFEPSIDAFFYNDGTSTSLLNVSGFVHVSKFLCDVPLTIWIHENYPILPPMVIISSTFDCVIHKNHPFIDISGAVASDYLNWDERSNLCTLVHYLANLFLHDHPSMPSSILKVTVLDDLVTKVCNDVASMNSLNSYEINGWSSRQVSLRKRAVILDGLITNLIGKREALEGRVIQLRNHNRSLSSWLQRNMASMDRIEESKFEDAIDAADEKSNTLLDCRAADRALDDVMYALDQALLEGLVEFDAYMRQVRIVARKQFHQRAMLVNLGSPLC